MTFLIPMNVRSTLMYLALHLESFMKLHKVT